MPPRQLAIDFVRGFTIALMMVVNNPGTWNAVYPPLLHAPWHGCTLTDLVFPFFLFIVGSSMWFSMAKQTGGLTTPLLLKILKRGGLLILVGMLLAKYPFFWKDWHVWRFPGVLQRIGLCYIIGAVAVTTLSLRSIIFFAASLLLGYWAALYFYFPTDPYALETNLVRSIDITVLTESHIWKGKGIPFDPEGLFSTLPAVVTLLLGWWAGRIIGTNDKTVACKQVLITGAVLTAVGYMWGWVFPLNKYLWSSSYVLYTAGLAMLLLGAAIWVLDIKRWQRWAQFFLIYGANPLFAYVLAGVVVKTCINIKWPDPTRPNGTINLYNILYEQSWGSVFSGKFGSMLFSFNFCLFIWFFCLYLFRKRIFVKL
jgi:predicted acyltransferase